MSSSIRHSPKGDTLVQNQTTVIGTGATNTVTDPVDTTIDRAPQVTGVFVNGTGWSQTFRDHLAAIGQGDATLGFRIPAGANQLDVIPWVGIDEFSLRFSELVDIQLLDLQLVAIDPITINSFNDLGDAGTWSLAAPLGTNNVRALLPDSVTDAVGNQALDGEWTDGTATFNSGDGVPGGEFSFRFNVVNGDGNRDGATSITDVVNMSSRSATGEMITSAGTATANSSIFFDINGDGGTTGTDISNAVDHLRDQSPAAEPGGTPGSGWVADASPTPPRPAGSPGTLDVTKTATLVVDIDGDGEADPGDTIRDNLNIANNSGGTVQAVQILDTIDPDTTLVAGSLNFPANITSSPEPSAVENTTFVIGAQSTDPDGETENGGGLTSSVENMTAGDLGSIAGTQLNFDVYAAGYASLVDSTAGNDVEFETVTAGSERAASDSSQALGRMDLLTVAMHKLGHRLGVDQSDDPFDLMAERLARGTRRLLHDDLFADDGALDDMLEESLSVKYS